MTAYASNDSSVIKDLVLRFVTSGGGALHRRIYGTILTTPATPVTEGGAVIGGIEDTPLKSTVTTQQDDAGQYRLYPSVREYEPDDAGPNILVQPYGGAASTYIGYVYSADCVADNLITVRNFDRAGGVDTLADPTKLAVLVFGSRWKVWRDQISTTRAELFNRCLVQQEDAAGDGRTHLCGGTIQYAPGATAVITNGAGVSSVSRTAQGKYDVTLSCTSDYTSYPLVFVTAWNNSDTTPYLCSVRFTAGTYDTFEVCVWDKAGAAQDPDYVSVIAIVEHTSPWTADESLTAANLGRLISVGTGETEGCALSFGAFESNGGARYASSNHNNLAAAAHTGDTGIYGVTCTDAHDEINALWFVTPFRVGAAPGVDCAATIVSANTSNSAAEWYAWDISGGGAWPDTAGTYFAVMGIGV